MKQIIWGTDLHYNFPKHHELVEIHQSIRAKIDSEVQNALSENREPNETLAVIITGDTSEAHLLKSHLTLIRTQLKLPVFFVCGNHDYWKKKLSTTKELITKMSEETDVKWLGAIPYAKLTEKTAIVGHDGWYDARYGDWENSNFFMNDWNYIPEFHGKTKKQIVDFCRELAQISTDHIELGFKKAVDDGFKHIIVATHVPPFRESSIYGGRKSEETAVCWYTNCALGEKLYELSFENPDVDVTVLCGHTHNGITNKILKNLTVHVGSAQYYNPNYSFVGLWEGET